LLGIVAGSLLPQAVRNHGEHLARPTHAHTAGRSPQLVPGHHH